MTEKLQDTFKALLTVLTVLFVLGLCLRVSAQEPWSEGQEWRAEAVAIPDDPEPECDHDSNLASRFQEVRLLPPAQIKNYDSKSIEYLHSDKFGIHIGRLYMTPETVLPKDMWKNYKGKYFWLLYCSLCKHVYTIVEVLPSQLKATKKT